MDPIREIAKWLVWAGILIAAVGVILLFGARLPIRLGRLPGDFAFRSRHSTFYFPLMTSIVLSVILTLILWLVAWLRR